MRNGGKPQFFEYKGRVFGVNLPADYCAEHERGIEKLQNLFGIQRYGKLEGPCGLERRQATIVPSKEKNRWGYADFIYEERNKMAALTVGFRIFHHNETEDSNLFDQLPSNLKFCVKLKDHEFVHGAWCENSFGLIVKGDKNIANLRNLRDQIEAVNVAVFLGGGAVFENPGLVIAYVDCFPDDAKQNMKKIDEDQIKLYQAAEETGIKNRICENIKNQYGGDPFFALSPSWNKGQRKNTKHKVIFYLNPCDQENNNYGWFTVEELEQWIKGKGPVVKKQV